MDKSNKRKRKRSRSRPRPKPEPVPADATNVGEVSPTQSSTKENVKEFTIVRRNRKRKADDDTMETEPAILEPIVPPKPNFPPAKRGKMMDGVEIRKIHIPNNRRTPLKENWLKIFQTVVEHLKLTIRFNLVTKCVEIKPSEQTDNVNALQKAEDFITAFVLGFEVNDILAIVRLDDLFMQSFQVQDVKPLKGEHLSRAVGRIAGTNGKTKFTIENLTKTRIILANTKVHILGTFLNIQVAKRAICNLILGSPPSKVYGNLKTMSVRLSTRF